MRLQAHDCAVLLCISILLLEDCAATIVLCDEEVEQFEVEVEQVSSEACATA